MKIVEISKEEFDAKVENLKPMMRWDSEGYARAKELDMIEGTGDKYVKQYLAGDVPGMIRLIETTEDGVIEYRIKKVLEQE